VSGRSRACGEDGVLGLDALGDRGPVMTITNFALTCGYTDPVERGHLPNNGLQVTGGRPSEWRWRSAGRRLLKPGCYALRFPSSEP
jgi:hypothetical protein